MDIRKYCLWEKVPGTTASVPYLLHYIPDKKKTDSAILILPGSGYFNCPALPRQEGDRVARYLCEKGFIVFILVYRVHPDLYPLPLLDGRRAMRYLRYHSDQLGICKEKIVTLGYSSGGHLAATLTSYREALAYEGVDALDREDYVPNLQALCYPVISITADNYYSHRGSARGLLNDQEEELQRALSLDGNTEELIPPTFIWHNFNDAVVSVVNSLRYAENLRQKGTSVEMHIFPEGGHGVGLPTEDRKDWKHDKKWIDLFLEWLAYQEF